LQHSLIRKLHNHVSEHMSTLSQPEKLRIHESIDWLEREFADRLTESQSSQGRRVSSTIPATRTQTSRRQVDTISEATMTYLRAEADWLKRQDYETAAIFLLNESGDVIGAIRQPGQARECLVDVLAIADAAAKVEACSTIVLHNHPNMQTAEPSQLDLEGTQQIREGLSSFNVELWDHLIIARSGHAFSFRESTQGPRTSYDQMIERDRRLWGPGGRPF
jgi:hypothetical protein